MLHESAVKLAEATSNTVTGAVPPDFSGHWKNQMTSTMDLVVVAGEVTGVYTSASSGAGGPITSRDLKGYVSGDLIAFLVKWPGGSMTSWVGQMVDDATATPRIKTLWHLVTEVPDADEDEKFWLSTLAGSDEFTGR